MTPAETYFCTVLRAVPGNRHSPFVFARTRIKMFEYERPTVDNLINNLPSVLKSSRQFVCWNIERRDKKVPLQSDGRSWGNYNDPKCWRTFDDALALLDNGRAFGIGLALPSPEQIKTLPDFNLIAGLVAFDADAKRSSTAAPFKVPVHISEYVRSANSYSEFSPSLKGLRALIFGDLPTTKQCLSKPFADGTELSLYRTGWVTLSGLPYGDSSPTIEHRQQIVDQIVGELWPELILRTVDVQDGVSACAPPIHKGENFILDWSCTVSESRIRQFIQGRNRTPKQVQDITATWELKRGWNHGSTADESMYTKRILEEALWLQLFFGWTLQDVVDIVITFCKKHQLCWSSGRAKKQIAHGQRYIDHTRRRIRGVAGDFAPLTSLQITPLTLTCNDSQIIREGNKTAETMLSGSVLNELQQCEQRKSTDTLPDISEVDDKPKLSGGFRHKSAARDAVLRALNEHPGWVKATTIAAETGKSSEAVRKNLCRLTDAGFVDRDRNGRYRKHHERRQRSLKPCSSKPIPKGRGTDKERQTLSRSELSKRGWPMDLIDKMFPEAGKDYKDMEIPRGDWSGRIVRTRIYWVSRIKALELEPWFENMRAEFWRRPRAMGHLSRARPKQP